MLLNNQWVTEESKEIIKKYLEDKRKWKHNNPKSMGHSKYYDKREFYSSTSLPQEIRKTAKR